MDLSQQRDRAVSPEAQSSAFITGRPNYTRNQTGMLKVHTKNLGAVAILCLQGRLVKSELVALQRAVNSQENKNVVILDLAGVSTIDGGGLGVMLELREQVQSKSIDFKLMNVTKLVTRVLEITHLNSVFEVTSEVEISARVSTTQPISPLGAYKLRIGKSVQVVLPQESC